MKMERTLPGHMPFSHLADPDERFKAMRKMLHIDMLPDRGGTSAVDRRLRRKGLVYTPADDSTRAA